MSTAGNGVEASPSLPGGGDTLPPSGLPTAASLASRTCPLSRPHNQLIVIVPPHTGRVPLPGNDGHRTW